MAFIGMTKKQAEINLGRTLTNDEFSKYVWGLNFGNKTKPQTKKATKQQKTESKTLKFVDAKNEFIETTNRDKEYYKKSCEYALKFGDNYLLFDKPSIETRFCFGYGLNGVSTGDDYEAASDMRDYANTNEKYFLNENLEALNHNIETMKAMINPDKYEYCEKMYKQTNEWFYHKLQYTRKIYLCKNNDNTCYLFNDEGRIEDENRLRYCTILKELTTEDFEKILKVYEQQKENFVKRLQTYLKKYGLSKLHTWTYLVD